MTGNEELSIEYDRPPLTSYQTKILDSPARYTVVEASTKTGKTASHIVWLLEQALNPKLKEGDSVWWVAPVYTQAKIAYNRMKVQMPDKAFFVANETNLTLTLPTGVIIQFKSAEKPDNLYGDDVYAAVFDEFTRARPTAWYALRSTLTATKGKCKFIGNVKGRSNWGYKLAQKAKGGEDNHEYFKITAYDAAKEGLLSVEEIEQAKRDLPESVFNELYLAEASEDGSNPFGINYIKRALFPLSSANPVCFGIDLADKKDYFTVIGLDASGIVCYFYRARKIGWPTVKERIIQLPNIPMELDSTGVGDPIVEDVQITHSRAIGKKFTTISKQQLIEGLALGIQTRKIGIPPDPDPDGVIPVTDPGNIQRELESFEYTHTRSGIRYSAPEGLHDDCVCALALAYDIFKTIGPGGVSWA